MTKTTSSSSESLCVPLCCEFNMEMLLVLEAIFDYDFGSNTLLGFPLQNMGESRGVTGCQVVEYGEMSQPALSFPWKLTNSLSHLGIPMNDFMILDDTQ